MLSLLLDVVQHVVSWFFWIVAMGAWWVQAKATRKYKGLWQRSFKLTEQHYDEAQRARTERDEMAEINHSLVDVIDRSEQRWTALEEEHKETVERSRRALTQALQRQREERSLKQAEGAARLMVQRGVLSDKDYADLVKKHGRRAWR